MSTEQAITPLESNPDVMNKFMHLLGVSEKWSITDVFGLDEPELLWIPQPVVALILLYPYDEKKVRNRYENLKDQAISPNLFYMKQFVSNTCGTVALIHSLANNTERMELTGPFRKIIDEAKDMSPEKRGELLMQSKEGSEAFNLIKHHQVLAMEGQTEAVPGQKVDYHYVALVEKDGHLYELDGNAGTPINHGETSQKTFLQDAANVCRKFMALNKDELNFTIMAVCAAEN